MKRITVLAGLTFLGILGGCSRQETPPPAAEDVEQAAPSRPAVEQPPERKVQDDRAAAMLKLVDESPQCQQYRDQLQAKVGTPVVYDELSAIFGNAMKAGCVKRREQ